MPWVDITIFQAVLQHFLGLDFCTKRAYNLDIMNKAYTLAISGILIVAALMPLSAGAYYHSGYYPIEPHLYVPGVDDQFNGTYVSTGYQPKPVTLDFNVFGGSSSNSSSTSPQSSSPKSTSFFGNLFGGTSSNPVAMDANGHAITLATADNINIYAIIAGKKHLIPNTDMLAQYNYAPSEVQFISQDQLNKYPTANLLMVKGDTKHIYFLTGSGMTRLIPSQKVMDSYGDRAEDAITISAKEFNFYPQNQYIYLENPLNRDVFQVVGGTGKRYLTPMAVMRLGITIDQVAPVNQTEMDSYKILAPVVQ